MILHLLLFVSSLNASANETVAAPAEAAAFKPAAVAAPAAAKASPVKTAVTVPKASPAANSGTTAAGGTTTKPSVAGGKDTPITLPAVPAAPGTTTGTAATATTTTGTNGYQFAPANTALQNSTLAQRPIIIMPGATTAPTTAAPATPPVNPMSSMPNFGNMMGGGSPSSSPSYTNNYQRQAIPQQQAASVAPTSATSSGAVPTNSQSFDVSGSGSCGESANMWAAVKSMSSDGPLKPGGGADLQSTNSASLSSDGRSSSFGPGQSSMCVSATQAAFDKYIANEVSQGKMTLSQDQIKFLNGPEVKAAIYGNAYSTSILVQALGGQSVAGTKANIADVLKQAKAGDILKFDRDNKTGHSTIFKDIEGDKFCFWSSNKGTNGAGVNCEPISELVDVTVSRLPDPATFSKNLSNLMQDSATKAKLKNGNKATASDVKASSGLTCSDSPGKASGAPSGTGSGDAQK